MSTAAASWSGYSYLPGSPNTHTREIPQSLEGSDDVMPREVHREVARGFRVEVSCMFPCMFVKKHASGQSRKRSAFLTLLVFSTFFHFREHGISQLSTSGRRAAVQRTESSRAADGGQ